jgi:hypothetical protein
VRSEIDANGACTQVGSTAGDTPRTGGDIEQPGMNANVHGL